MNKLDLFTNKAKTIPLTKTKQLFLDDMIISDMNDIRFEMHKPTKKGAVLTADTGIGEVGIQSRNSPQWNSEKKLWEWHYWGLHNCKPYGRWQSTMIELSKYAISDDGITWQKPNLRLYEYNGSKNNNITMDPDLGNRSLYHCYLDENDTNPERRYKGMMGRSNRVLAFSPDGLNWTKIDCEPLTSSDESSLMYDPTSQQFLVILKRGTQWGRSMALMTSQDFVEWEDHGIVMHADGDDWKGHWPRLEKVLSNPNYLHPPIVDEDQYYPETYNMVIHPYEGQYIGLVNIFDPAGAIPPPQMNYTALNQIGLASSRNLKHWRRLGNREMFMEISPWDGKNYDTQQLLPCGAPIICDDEIRVYYGGLRFRGHKELYPEKYHPYFNDMGAPSLATLRLDGYVSINADSDGYFITKPFSLNSQNLCVNIDSKQGQLIIELWDGESLEYLTESQPISIDSVNHQVTWKSDINISKPIRFKFKLKHAKLYAFWQG